MNCIICNKKLNSHNKIGVCRKHRSKSSVRKAYENQWKKANKDRYTEAKKQWSRKHPEYFVNWRKSSINRIIAHSLRVRLNRVVRGQSAIKNLGCDVSEFLAHLEKQFVERMRN